jgi:hypothetical protein
MQRKQSLGDYYLTRRCNEIVSFLGCYVAQIGS